MSQKINPTSQEMSMISEYGWNGVFSVIIQYEQRIDNPEVVIPQQYLPNPGEMNKFNNGVIDRISDEVGSFRKGADRIYRANVEKNSMHIRAYDDKSEFTAEIDSYNPSQGVPEAVKHVSEDIAS